MEKDFLVNLCKEIERTRQAIYSQAFEDQVNVLARSADSKETVRIAMAIDDGIDSARSEFWKLIKISGYDSVDIYKAAGLYPKELPGLCAK